MGTPLESAKILNKSAWCNQRGASGGVIHQRRRDPLSILSPKWPNTQDAECTNPTHPPRDSIRIVTSTPLRSVPSHTFLLTFNHGVFAMIPAGCLRVYWFPCIHVRVIRTPETRGKQKEMTTRTPNDHHHHQKHNDCPRGPPPQRMPLPTSTAEHPEESEI